MKEGSFAINTMDPGFFFSKTLSLLKEWSSGQLGCFYRGSKDCWSWDTTLEPFQYQPPLFQQRIQVARKFDIYMMRKYTIFL